MSKPRFQITLTVLTARTFTVAADDWADAVEKATCRAESLGLETTGSAYVADADGYPIDTCK
jgi:hypothetical protein